MKYRLIAVDIDGTLVKCGGKSLNENTKNTLIEAQKQGIKLVVASGRPIKGMTEILKELKIADYNGYAIVFNGARTYDLKSKKIVFENSLDVDSIRGIFEFAKENGFNCATYNEECFFIADPEEKYLKFIGTIEGHRIEKRDFFADPVDFGVPKILLSGEPCDLEKAEIKAKEKLGDKVNIFRSEPFILEFLPLNTDKGSALKELIKNLDVKKEEIIAFGDSYNDRTMINLVGLGIAMENAPEIVKKEADFVTLNVEDDGVAYAVKKFALQ